MSRLKIGLCSQGDERWTAGVIYLQNLIRACNLLPEQERPEFHFIFHFKTRVVAFRELGDSLPPEHAYSHQRIQTRHQQFRAAFKCLRTGYWPTSLESLASRLELSALFPVQFPLGESFPVPWLGWIPDFQHKKLPQFFSDQECRRRDQQFQQVIDESSRMVVSSRDSYNDLTRWFEVDGERVKILRFRTMIDPHWLKDAPEPALAAFDLPEKYLMFPSQFWVHKNHATLLKALGILTREGQRNVAVIFTGYQKDHRQPAHFQRIQSLIEELDLKRNVHYLGLLPRHVQIQVFRRAAAIVQPSYCEGWSSLVEDCRSLGKTIYLSDIPIHREQNPPRAIYFDPNSPEELAAHLKRDWDFLSPGPDFTSEAESVAQSRVLGREYARSFLKIVDCASTEDSMAPNENNLPSLPATSAQIAGFHCIND